MRILSLFSGGGLGDFGLELAGMEIAAQIEIDEFCQKILKLRWPHVPKWGDIKLVTGKEIIERAGSIDLISGGFPCQPFSVAGRRGGEKDERFLWGEMHRIICEVRPQWVLAENVPGLLSIDAGRTFGRVVRDLAESGYRVEWDCIPASAIGAPHRRDRIWVVAYAKRDSDRFPKRRVHGKKNRVEKSEWPQNGSAGEFGRASSGRISSQRHGDDSNSERVGRKKGAGKRIQPFKQTTVGQDARDLCEEIADPAGEGLEGHRQLRKDEEAIREEGISVFGAARKDRIRPTDFWAIEPNVGRVVDGTANRVDRLKLLGNGQVVQVVAWIGERIMDFSNIESN